jgi:hypothetical protein
VKIDSNAPPGASSDLGDRRRRDWSPNPKQAEREFDRIMSDQPIP